MSVEAITWALNLKVERSTAKFVLVAMANCANNDMTCWPSIQYLSDATCQDRKTVLENIKRLKDAGYIADTTLRKGRTGQVIVYQLKSPENGSCKNAIDAENTGSEHDDVIYGTGKHYVYRLTNPETKQFYIGMRQCIGEPESDKYMGSGRWPLSCAATGAVLRKEIIEVLTTRQAAAVAEQALIDEFALNPLCMNSTKTGTVQTVPKTDANSPVFPDKQSRFSAETDPKTGHGTVRNPKEPSKNRQGARGTRLPEDWVLTGKHAKEAHEIDPTWSADDIRLIGEMFKDHWIAAAGAKACKTDWLATWRNWCRNEKKMAITRKPRESGAWKATDAATIAKGAEFGLKPLAGEAMYTFRCRIDATIDNGGTPPMPRMSRVTPMEEHARTGNKIDLSAAKAILKRGKGQPDA